MLQLVSLNDTTIKMRRCTAKSTILPFKSERGEFLLLPDVLTVVADVPTDTAVTIPTIIRPLSPFY